MKNWDTLMNYERVRIENNRIRGKFLENCYNLIFRYFAEYGNMNNTFLI